MAFPAFGGTPSVAEYVTPEAEFFEFFVHTCTFGALAYAPVVDAYAVGVIGSHEGVLNCLRMREFGHVT